MQGQYPYPHAFEAPADRRTFLKGAALLSAGLMLNRSSAAEVAGTSQAAAAPPPTRSRVSFLTGTDRREMAYQAMMPFKDEIAKGIQGKQIIIKPNFVLTNNPPCATHVDAVRGVLDFIKPIYSGRIIIAESSAAGNTSPGFQAYGYLPLEREYNVSFIDLNARSSKPVWIIDSNVHPTSCQIIADFLDPNNYFISITRPKTHDSVVATLGLKNMVMAAPINQSRGNGRYQEKRTMHAAGPRWLHYNMFLVAHQVRPDFTVIDGLEGMEGNGPVRGTAIGHGIALAGTDVMAVDSIGTQLMGIPLENVGYLTYCGQAGLGITDRSKIDIVGEKSPADYVKAYRMPSRIDELLDWKMPLRA